jgi:hypothetical protein
MRREGLGRMRAGEEGKGRGVEGGGEYACEDEARPDDDCDARGGARRGGGRRVVHERGGEPGRVHDEQSRRRRGRGEPIWSRCRCYKE